MAQQHHSFHEINYRELLLTVALFGAGLAVRLPDLQLVPRFQDEALEVLWGYDIARGARLPLTAVDPYYGPLFAYLIAALFRIFGFNVLLPRLMIALFGALTVAATYWLGRALWNRPAGLVAAGLALTSPTLVVISSHFGWSNSLTPFFAALTMLAVYVGVERRREGVLALSGLLGALTLQTHPISGVLLAGLAAWFVLRRDVGAWLRRRGTYAAVALFLIGYAPMLIANVRPDSPMLTQAEIRDYAFAPTLSLTVYLQRMAALVQRVFWIVGGSLSPGTIGLRLVVLIMGLLLVGGLALAWRRGNSLPLVVLGATVVLLPTVVWNYSDATARYLLFLAPLAYVVVGGMIVEILRVVGAASARLAVPSPVRLAPQAVVALLTLVLVLYPVATISAYYNYALATGQHNEDFFRLSATLRADQACGGRLYVENVGKALEAKNQWPQWFTLFSIHYVLALDGCPHTFVTTQTVMDRLTAGGSSGWVILPNSSVARFSQQFRLEPVAVVAPPLRTTLSPFGLYRVAPRP